MRTQFQYRVWQFLQTLKRAPTPSDYQKTAAYLSQDQELLFRGMSGVDQNHSIRVFDALRKKEGDNRDLLVAGLLHDVGKQRFPLRRWERVFFVLLKAAAPGRVESWGEEPSSGWRRFLVAARQHAAWGADMAREARCSPLTVWLIKNHETSTPQDPPSPHAVELLRQLQHADNRN